MCTVVETSSLPKLKQTEAVVLQGFGWESHRGSNGKSWWAVLKDKVPDIQVCGNHPARDLGRCNETLQLIRDTLI